MRHAERASRWIEDLYRIARQGVTGIEHVARKDPGMA